MVHGSGEDNFHNALNLSAHTVAVMTLYLLKIMSQRWNSYSKIQFGQCVHVFVNRLSNWRETILINWFFMSHNWQDIKPFHIILWYNSPSYHISIPNTNPLVDPNFHFKRLCPRNTRRHKIDNCHWFALLYVAIERYRN